MVLAAALIAVPAVLFAEIALNLWYLGKDIKSLFGVRNFHETESDFECLASIILALLLWNEWSVLPLGLLFYFVADRYLQAYKMFAQVAARIYGQYLASEHSVIVAVTDPAGHILNYYHLRYMFHCLTQYRAISVSLLYKLLCTEIAR
jgi:hypothetical protein